MAKVIDSPIIGSRVVKEKDKGKVLQLHEKIERPTVLEGKTYKITPFDSHSFYITINDIVLNQGTEQEIRRPFEIFINTKNTEQFEWIVALTRLMSAVFRKGGDVSFIIEEMHSIFNPKGGYFLKGKFYPSVIHHIGDIIEKHFQFIGILDVPEKKVSSLSNEKFPQKEFEEDGNIGNDEEVVQKEIKGAQCKVCYQYSVINRDGCMTCLNCGDSKCS